MGETQRGTKSIYLIYSENSLSQTALSANEEKKTKETELQSSERNKMNPFGKKQEPELEYFAIYDSKSQTYNEPMLAANRFVMLRQINDLFQDSNQSKNQLFLNAEDFSLFKVGEYSKKTGQILGQSPEHIANLHELKAGLSTRAL